MNTAPAQKLDTKAIKTVKEQLAERASPRCSKCGGRGHLGVNIDTDRHIICKCVKRAAKTGNGESEGESAVGRMLREAAAGRIAQNEAHLKRLHAEIGRLRAEETEIGIEAVGGGLTDEEQEVQLEAEFEKRRLALAYDVAAAYAKKKSKLLLDADALIQTAIQFDLLAKEARDRAAYMRNEATEMGRDSAAGVDRMMKEEKTLLQGILGKANQMEAQRAARAHKLNKRLRETQGRIEKLMVRAGKAQGAIEEDRKLAERE